MKKASNKPIYMLAEDVVKMLKERQGVMNQIEFAAKIGMSQQLLSDTYAGRRVPGAAVLQFLGLDRVVVYTQKGQ